MSSEPQDREIILRPSRELTIGRGSDNSVFSRMTKGVVDLARSHEGAQLTSLKRIGKFELADADYETVLMWSDELSMSPECIMNHLEKWRECVGRIDFLYNSIREIDLRIENGRFKSLVWDFERLPITRSDWCDRLALDALGCWGTCSLPKEELNLQIGTLQNFV